MNSKSSKFSPEVRKRTVQMVLDHRGEYPSLWAAIESIAGKTGCTAQTLRNWVTNMRLIPECEAVLPAMSRRGLKPESVRLKSYAVPMRS
jgi:hypothetical protein